jgi:hypothetical protein
MAAAACGRLLTSEERKRKEPGTPKGTPPRTYSFPLDPNSQFLSSLNSHQIQNPPMD